MKLSVHHEFVRVRPNGKAVNFGECSRLLRGWIGFDVHVSNGELSHNDPSKEPDP